jgi:4-hydroxybenzoate polyprenyltransferase
MRNPTPAPTLIVSLAFAVVLLVGGAATIADPDALPISAWLALVAIAAIPAGLLAIGHGIEQYGKQRAGAHALGIAHDLGHTHRPHDPEADMPAPPYH